MRNTDGNKLKKSTKIVEGIFAVFSVLSIVAKLKRVKEENDADLQKDKLDGAGKPVSNGKKTLYEAYVKRGVDVILSFLGLVILSPIFLMISVAIIIDDPGPVLFTQKRVGINKTYFKLHKFRSMKMSTPHDTPTHMLENPEQYITKVGRILRRYSLDELPQIWDIWVGKLSICGPRPALWNQNDLVSERDKYRANDVKPGLTGWAQINGRDELEISDKAKLDGEYVAAIEKGNVSGFLMDVKCFVGTITSVLKHDGVVEGGTGEINKKNQDDAKVQIGFGKPVTVDFTLEKKVLITGANSYIGEAFEVYAKEHYSNNFEIDTIDMIDGSWREKDFSGYDTVFHVAGIAHADVGNVSEETKKKYYAVNTDLTIETAQKAKDSGVKQFVFMSSMIVYGDSAPYGKEKMITASTKPEPANFYGDSKWQADKGVRALTTDDFNVLVLRPPMIYGKGSKGNYPILATLAKKLPVFPNVNNQRSMLNIDNLCEFLCQVMLVGEGGVFFPQNSEYTKTADMVKQISRVWGKKIFITRLLNPAVWVASKVPGKIGGLVDKAFGNSCYDQSMSEYAGIDYRVVNLEESIKRTEGKQEFLQEKKNNSSKALMLASVASMIDQFNMDNIQILIDMGYQVDVVADFVDGGTITSERIVNLKKRLKEMNVTVHHVPIPRKIMDIKDILSSYKQVKQLCDLNQYQIVHCHSPIGGVIARLAARETRKHGTKVIYTAHGFHFYDGAPKKNWLMFYPIEKVCSRWTDILITINQEDYKRAKEKFHANRVVYVPGVGVDTEKFQSGLIDIEKKRAELKISEKDIMMLSVVEFNEGMDYEIVIKAIKELGNSDLRYFICGKGDWNEYLNKLISELGLKNQVTLLGDRTDISELCQASDLFVSASCQKGQAFSLMEAIACQIPVVCSRTEENEKLVEDYLFDANNVKELMDLLRDIVTTRETLHDKMKDSVLRNYNSLKLFDLSKLSDEKLKDYKLREISRLLRQQQFKKELGISLNGTLLLSVGELNKNKNHSTVIKALASLKDESIHYCIAGTGCLKKELENLAEDMGVEKQIHLLGYRNDINELLQIVDIFLLPSMREGLNVSLMEAMASGVPCICSAIRGNVDLIKDGKGGYIYKSTDMDGFAEGIEKIMNDGGKNMAAINIATMKRFDVAAVNTRMKKIYRGL